jgi:ATP-binding cassette subfamily B (MDR/TAP) protein 1
MSVMMSVMSIGNIVVPITSVTKAAGAACTFFALIDSPTVDAGGLRDPDVSTQSDIVFKDVVFAYPTRPKTKVLDGMNISFEKGKLTAIVGPSGSGKSTVVGLIERWYELSQLPETGPAEVTAPGTSTESVDEKKHDDAEEPVVLSGLISIDGHNLKDLDLKWWRSQIGLVQQEPFVFNDTIYNNMLHGLTGSKFENEDDETKKALVEEACREAFADEFIEKLPLVSGPN